MLVATYDGKVRLRVYIQLTLERKPFRFFTKLKSRSCIVLTYWLADSVCVSVVIGYVLRACVVALECFPLLVVMTRFVAVVAHVAAVIDMRRGMMLSSTSWLLPNITLITFITLLALISVVSIAKRFTHPAHVATT